MDFGETPSACAYSNYPDSDRTWASIALRAFGGLTFDMRGGRRQAKPDVGRPLDGRVRLHLQPVATGLK
jgi:hypothetical protein